MFKVYMGCHMAKVSISKAAKLAGVSRTAFYKSYINKGLISTSRDEAGKKCIDTSEILRVFGELKMDTVDSVNNTLEQPTKTPTHTDLLVSLGEFKAEKKYLDAQLSAACEREAFYQKQITELTNTIKLLKAPTQTQHPRLWYQFWR